MKSTISAFNSTSTLSPIPPPSPPPISAFLSLMQIGTTETLLDLIDQIAFKRTVVWNQRGTLGVPDIKDGEISAYKPLILPGILGRPVGCTHAYPARIVPGVPDTAKEHTGLALCRAIVRAHDRDAAMMKIVEVMGNRACDGAYLDSTALAEIIAETYEHLMQEEDLSKKVDYADGLHLITHYFRTMVASAYGELILDEWETVLDGPVSLTRLINISSFYGYLHSCGLIRSWEFLKTLDVILDEYTSGSLDLLMIAAIYLMSRATLNSHARRVLPRKYWEIVLGQLNDIEVRHRTGRGATEENMEEHVVEMICGNSLGLTETHAPPRPVQQAQGGAQLRVLADAHRAAEIEWSGHQRSEHHKASSCATVVGNPTGFTTAHSTSGVYSKATSDSGSDSEVTVVGDQPSTTFTSKKSDPEMPEPIDPNDPSEVYFAAIDTLRYFVSEFLDADTAACIFEAPWWPTGYVDFCLDPPRLRSNEARYMIQLCEKIKMWANVEGIEDAEMDWEVTWEEFGDGKDLRKAWEKARNRKLDGGAVGKGEKCVSTGPDVNGEEDDGQELVVRAGDGWTKNAASTPTGARLESAIRMRRGINAARGPLRVDVTLTERKHREPLPVGPSIAFIDPRISGNNKGYAPELFKTHEIVWRLDQADGFFHPHGVQRAEMGIVQGKTAEECAALCDQNMVDPLTRI